MKDFPEMMTVKETADFLRCSVRSIYDRLKRGNIPAIKDGHEWRISKTALIDKARVDTEKRKAAHGGK